jgi:hypothetical protein
MAMAAPCGSISEKTGKARGLADSARFPAALLVLVRQVLVLVILVRVSRDGFLGDFLHQTLRVLFPAR